MCNQGTNEKLLIELSALLAVVAALTPLDQAARRRVLRRVQRRAYRQPGSPPVDTGSLRRSIGLTE